MKGKKKQFREQKLQASNSHHCHPRPQQKCQFITKSFANLFFFGANIEKKKRF